MLRHGLPVLFIMLAAPAAARAADEEDLVIPSGYRAHIWQLDEGHVDWCHGVVIGRGEAPCGTDREQDRNLAKRAALAAGSRNAVAIGNRLQIDRRLCISDLDDSEIHLEVAVGKHQTAAVEWIGSPPDQTCRLHLVVPFWGEESLAELAIEDVRQRAKSVGRIPRAPPRFDAPPAGDVILIDARGTHLLPCMFPIVLIPEGHVLYDFTTRTQVHGEIRPAVRYIESETPAAAAPAATSIPTTRPAKVPPAAEVDEGPIHVRAVQAGGPFRTDIMLRRDDAKMLAQSVRASRLMKEGRVCVIVDPPSSPASQPASRPSP